MEGRSFLREFEIKRYIKKDVKMPCKCVSLFIGAPLGNLEGIRLPGLFEPILMPVDEWLVVIPLLCFFELFLEI